MFSFFKSDPTKKLKKDYLKKLEEAMQLQRSGKIREYSILTAEAEQLREKIEAIENSQ
ncbi:hypothetical protein GP2143_09245 [marine gamma proteobacterium HTCC2143]|uniref:Lacal_2735 family protein n=1 Tax=marine gamma proteobacterium HTCC2143 TaxID=247633 RepID=A0YFG5_9GAMM|nr:hypothetical protein GP2143_09245 [marine gamma proteobacterium HTCC2143]